MALSSALSSAYILRLPIANKMDLDQTALSQSALLTQQSKVAKSSMHDIIT